MMNKDHRENKLRFNEYMFIHDEIAIRRVYNLALAIIKDEKQITQKDLRKRLIYVKHCPEYAVNMVFDTLQLHQEDTGVKVNPIVKIIDYEYVYEEEGDL